LIETRLGVKGLTLLANLTGYRKAIYRDYKRAINCTTTNNSGSAGSARSRGAYRRDGEDIVTTRGIIEKYFECVNRGDWETWLTLFDDNVVIDEAISGHLEGMQALRESTEGTARVFSKFRNYPEEIVVEGNKAMVVCRIDGITTGGVPLESKGANYYRIENGKIAYMASFHDRKPFIEAFPILE
jgi:ketosteroid isomerase-like protein